jgi:hypothetical protein
MTSDTAEIATIRHPVTCMENRGIRGGRGNAVLRL